MHLVLVDNNSNDNTFNVLWQWAKQNSSEDFKITVCSELKPGAAAARNRGMQFVNSTYLLFFDSDDTMHPDLCKRYLQKFHRFPKTDIVYTGANYHKLDGSVCKLKVCRHRLLRKHIYHAILRTQGYAVRREYIQSCGCWDANMLGWNDWELGIRLLINAPVVRFLSGENCDIYAQKESISGTDFSSKPHLWENALNKADQIIEKSTRKDKVSLHRLIDYRRIVLAAHYAVENAEDEANRLYNKTMKNKKQDIRMKLLMPLAYKYIKHGGRGAATLLDLLL